jgi:methyltransferase (TIGR00027 family)
MYVARLRYIQTVHEPEQRRNPDVWVRHFIPLTLRLRTRLLAEKELTKLRSDPFYYYLVARTKHYDQVVKDALADGIERFVMIGCGSDTRSYRFQDQLLSKGIKVLECDQAEAINEKKRLTKKWQRYGHVEYLAIDLNDGEWPKLEFWLGNSRPKTLVMIEGVSPYIHDNAFERFLHMLASRLAPGSHVAYDFKVGGINDDFGRGGRTQKPFRLSTSKPEVEAYHRPLGLKLEHMELGPALSKRMLPDLNGSPLFEEDGLLRLKVIGA